MFVQLKPEVAKALPGLNIGYISDETKKLVSLGRINRGETLEVPDNLLDQVLEQNKGIEARESPTSVESDEEKAFNELLGVSVAVADRMTEAGYDNFEEIAAANIEDLTQIEGIGAKTAQKIIDTAKSLLDGTEKK